jgi:hypothetical protein
MGKYAGIPCVSCEKEFGPDDDVVVCPICGAPHHRSCYEKTGKCALHNLHDAGFEWKAPAPAAAQQAPPSVCTNCNAVNPPGQEVCRYCGQAIPAAQPPLDGAVHEQAFAASESAREPRETDNIWTALGVSQREVTSYVGPGALYFIDRFHEVMRTQNGRSWNWVAFFFGYLYFFYRKMYRLGLAVLGIMLFINIPNIFYIIEYFKAEYAPLAFGVTLPYDQNFLALLNTVMFFMGILRFVMMFWCGLFTNKLYLKKVVDDIKQLRKTFGAQTKDYYFALYQIGRPNILAVVVLLGAGMLLSFYLSSYLLSLLPVDQIYRG